VAVPSPSLSSPNRLEGNFPGGVVDLVYRFALVDGLIADLAIVP
jgi:hypothetical protein